MNNFNAYAVYVLGVLSGVLSIYSANYSAATWSLIAAYWAYASTVKS